MAPVATPPTAPHYLQQMVSVLAAPMAASSSVAFSAALFVVGVCLGGALMLVATTVTEILRAYMLDE
jgi:hypothetical protein